MWNKKKNVKIKLFIKSYLKICEYVLNNYI